MQATTPVANSEKSLEDSIPSICHGNDQVLTRFAAMEKRLQSKTCHRDLRLVILTHFAVMPTVYSNQNLQYYDPQHGSNNKRPNRPRNLAQLDLNPLSRRRYLTQEIVIPKFNCETRTNRPSTAALERSMKIEKKIEPFDLVQNQ